MDDEIEDMIGDIKYTDSQKSVATTNVYSLDFTESSSDQNNSSGKNTYVLEYDSDDSDKVYNLHNIQSVINLNDKSSTKVKVNYNVNVQCDPSINKSVSTSLHRFVSQEIFTQTSKTIFELAKTESALGNNPDNKAIETQTSRISIIENKTVEYRIEVTSPRCSSGGQIKETSTEIIEEETTQDSLPKDQNNTNLSDLMELNLPTSDTEEECTADDNTGRNSGVDIIEIVDEETISKEKQDEYENTSYFEGTSKFGSDFEEDSLTEDNNHPGKSENHDSLSEVSVSKSVNNDVEELYDKLSESLDIRSMEKPDNMEVLRCSTLTPLTEESLVKKESFIDITPYEETIPINNNEDQSEDVIFINNSGVKIKIWPQEEKVPLTLPPIISSPYNGNTFNKLSKTKKLPHHYEGPKDRPLDRWEIGSKNLASGENADVVHSKEREHKTKECLLPPIFIEGHLNYGDGTAIDPNALLKGSSISSDTPHESICIQAKIKELKLNSKGRNRIQSPERSLSPASRASQDGSRPCELAERTCEVICGEVIRKLRVSSWFSIVDVLEELPRNLEKFWEVITEQRIADLIRQVTVHVDSPRTQVARTACTTLAVILKNTNYTKKPDFYEAVTTLLVKTGSFSKPVRRAANVALDDIVCGVDISHAVTAICIQGVGHKSPLVRCASARLLVVCAALSGGGRELLRARPATAAAARRFALRSLAALLEDKCIDTRKYAERLYSMLRPLTNFEAYYLTDVNVELASRQMKKYDQLLLCGPPRKDTR